MMAADVDREKVYSIRRSASTVLYCSHAAARPIAVRQIVTVRIVVLNVVPPAVSHFLRNNMPRCCLHSFAHRRMIIIINRERETESCGKRFAQVAM